MRNLAMALPCLLFVSCATMVSGRNQNVTIDSEPTGSNVVVSCANGTNHQGQTPLTVSLQRNGGTCNVAVQRDGYAQERVVLEQGVNRAYWLNFVSIPLAMCTVVGWNGFGTEPDGGSRAVGTACAGVAIAMWATDKRSGAVWTYEPKSVKVVLKRNE